MKVSPWKVAGIVAAATVGDGIFALPFVFYKSGWLIGVIYLVVLGGLVVLAHTVYFKALERVGEKERLLGLARKYFGAAGFWAGFIAIVLGLLLTLVAYLILGMHFIELGLPAVPPPIPLFFFWAFVAITVFLNDTYVMELELAGITATALIIVFIFATAWPDGFFNGMPIADWRNILLPFGAVLFSLAGWPAIEPAYESRKREIAERSGSAKPKPGAIGKGIWLSLGAGTAFAALLYTMFAAGILGTAGTITADTISGLANWPIWKKDILAALGLIAVWTVSMPISREIRNSLEHDLKWKKLASRATIVFVPLLFVLAGLNNFLVVVGLVGGFFLSAQYVIIVSVGRRALAPSPVRAALLDLVALLFMAAAVYEVWTFIVH